jgi:HAD superfamily hydrolase (TIGR01509 family)
MSRASNHRRLAEVLAATGPVLLDFDGPMCRVYRGDLNIQAADRLRGLLHDNRIDLPYEIEQAHDPLEVLRYSGQLEGIALVEDIEAALTDIEVGAVVDAPSTPGAHEFLHACAVNKRPIVIVSNNAGEAIARYLELHNLSQLVQGIVGRSHVNPQKMKPHPEPIRRALGILGTPPSQSVLIGDSPTDIQVGKQAGLRTVAYVNRPSKRERLHEQGPDAFVDDMAVLARLIGPRSP